MRSLQRDGETSAFWGRILSRRAQTCGTDQLLLQLLSRIVKSRDEYAAGLFSLNLCLEKASREWSCGPTNRWETDGGTVEWVCD